MKQPRYTVHKVDDYTAGRAAWGIWDHERDGWADDLGRFLSEEGAREAIPKTTKESDES